MNDTRRRPAAMEPMCWLTCTRLVSRWLAVPEARALNGRESDAIHRPRLVDTSSPRGKLQSPFKFSRRFTREVQTGSGAEKLSILLKGAQHNPIGLCWGQICELPAIPNPCGPVSTFFRPAIAPKNTVKT